jgi:hypothetical protein
MRGHRLLVVGALLAVAGFTLASLLVYRFRPTAGTVFLAFGWVSLLGTGYLLVRAVAAFDLHAGGVGAAGLSVTRRVELEREKKLLVKAIKEVEFDRDSGKLDGGEAAGAIARYRARAVEILRQLDESEERRIEALVEAELERRLATSAKADAPGAPPTCAACQAVNDDDAAFCKKCGAKLGPAS